MPSSFDALPARLQRRIRGLRAQSVICRPNPSAPDLLPDFQFFAVIKTWTDEDIIEACVRNALTQGVSAVFLVDNGSRDGTVDVGLQAGARLAESYDTNAFDDRVAQLFVNAVVARESFKSGAHYVWWLYLDADEFPEGPGGTTLASYLATLDSQFRLAGSTYHNHYPTGRPEYIPGFHPIDFQPMCEQFTPDYLHCTQGHWKHPLQRFDRNGPFLMCADGFHTATVGKLEPLYEPAGGIVTHHFQHREEKATRAKAELAVTRSSRDKTRASRAFQSRLRSLDAIYAQRWADVSTRSAPRGARPRPWSGPDTVRRWYEPADVQAAKERWLLQRGPAERS